MNISGARRFHGCRSVVPRQVSFSFRLPFLLLPETKRYASRKVPLDKPEGQTESKEAHRSHHRVQGRSAPGNTGSAPGLAAGFEMHWDKVTALALGLAMTAGGVFLWSSAVMLVF